MAPPKIRHGRRAWVSSSTWWLLLGGLVSFILSGCHPQQQPPEVTPEATPPPEATATPMASPMSLTSHALPNIQEQVLQPGDRRYTIAIPASYTGDQPVPLVLALHYGGTVTPYYGKGFLVGLVEPALRDLGAIIIAPDCTADDWTQPESETDVLALLDHVGYPIADRVGARDDRNLDMTRWSRYSLRNHRRLPPHSKGWGSTMP